MKTGIRWLGIVGGLSLSAGLAGCNPAPPPVAAPPVVAPPPAPVAPVQPAPMPIAVKPTPVQPAVAPPAANVDPALRDLAARLVEPTAEGGFNINESAALELDRLGSDAPAKLLPLFADEKLEVRRGAAFHLLSSFDPAAKDQMVAYSRLLSDPDPTVRGLGLQAAKQMTPEDITTAMPQLTALLDPNTETKPKNRADLARFAGSLNQKGMPFARALSKSAVNDPDERVRSAAIFSLTQIAKPDDYLPTLQKGLADKQPAVRVVAAGRLKALGMQAQPVADALGKALSDSDERVRTMAAEALVKIGVLAVPVLGEQLSSPDVNARKLSLACLSSLGAAAKSELSKIEKLQQDQDADIRDASKVLVARLKQ